MANNLLVLVLHGTQFACAGTTWHTICLCWYYMAYNLLVLDYMAYNLLVLVLHGTQFACAGNA